MSRPLERLDGWQRQCAVAALPIALARKFLDDRASTLAALVAYYAFFSLFPCCWCFTVGGRIGAGAERLGALGGALVVNVAGFFAVFALPTMRPVRFRELLPGVVLAAVGALVLQSVGGW